MLGEPADGRGVRAAVVVDDDDELAVLGCGDVVERFPRHAAGQRAVADERDDVPVLTSQVVRLGEAVCVRQRRRRVGVLDDVVLGLGLARIAGQATLLPQGVEVGSATGEDLVDVRLVAGVEHDPVVRRVEDPMDGDGQLDHAEVGAEVAARSVTSWRPGSRGSRRRASPAVRRRDHADRVVRSASPADPSTPFRSAAFRPTESRAWFGSHLALAAKSRPRAWP